MKIKENKPDQIVNDFYKKITDWLIPKGYVQVYTNHPLSKFREFHFIKDGIRVVCVNGTEEYCYLSKDIMKPVWCLTLKTGRFEISTDKLD